MVSFLLDVETDHSVCICPHSGCFRKEEILVVLTFPTPDIHKGTFLYKLNDLSLGVPVFVGIETENNHSMSLGDLPLQIYALHIY